MKSHSSIEGNNKYNAVVKIVIKMKQTIPIDMSLAKILQSTLKAELFQIGKNFEKTLTIRILTVTFLDQRYQKPTGT